ncbi:uncharacterized protein KIAA2026 [Salarias fasciatus]|uniref:Bromo domain-containing protein n=1 Tax=Salarias fasciatus TaxID=181472 RepID=A0A672J656_SALFA|nr:uncharacterized protein KIAA2026 homolog [Salarias fasciatus]
MSSHPGWVSGGGGGGTDDLGLSNGACEVQTMVALRCPADAASPEADRLSLSNDGVSELSNSDLSLPEVCISSNCHSLEDDMSYEVQQAYRIFTGFLLDKHKGITGPFLNPVGHQEARHGVGGVKGRGQSQLRQSMCLRRMEEKFAGQEYESITEFVTDFRLMLENCYRYHGVDHWVSKQGQKLEVMLEQKLTLLSRTLREKTTLAVTSKGRFGTEEDRGSTGTSTRRRLAPRSLATLTVGGHESVMVQTLRLEEQQRAKEEKRQRELEKKEAEEMSAKEVDEWEQSLLSQAAPQAVDTLWELPAIGHFLCLAQTALNLPEVVFFELERCLLMPRCSLLLSKILSSLLCPSQRRATLHRRPALPYHRWESELRQRVAGWYRTVGASRDQPRRAEQLGLCHQFFGVLGEVSPLEAKPFHLLPFYQRVWLLKGLCDHVYETQKDVQDAVLAQPIHECRESILGYDSRENAYIHFPHFCGADLRIYCQSPSAPPAFPFPSVWVKKVEKQPGTDGEESDGTKEEEDGNDGECHGALTDSEETSALAKRRSETFSVLIKGKGNCTEEKNMFELWSRIAEDASDSGSSDSDPCEDATMHNNSLSVIHVGPSGGGGGGGGMKMNSSGLERQANRLGLQQEQGVSLGSVRTIKAETQEPCLNVGEHSYTGRSPARSPHLPSPNKTPALQAEGGSPSRGRPRSSCLGDCKDSDVKGEDPDCRRGPPRPTAHLSSESTPNSSEERVSDKTWTKKKRRRRKRGGEQLPRVKGENKQLSEAEAVEAALHNVSTSMKRKAKKKKHKLGKKSESSKKIKHEPPVEPSFKLVCTSLEELRELISKTEDELDDLESTKKRLGRWYYRREAVKELHSTLIRLLNELSPWEPKLIKAYQRNRLRLKKEFDDFKKQPEYNNFVREECISSSSDDDDDDEEDDEEKGLGNRVCSPADRSEEEDLEHPVPRGLWGLANTRESGMEPEKHSLGSPEKDVDLLPRVETVSLNMTSVDSKQHPGTELSPTNQSRDSASVSVLHPPSGLPKGYTPIPTLLAKSVGNKVTLMKRPAYFPGVSNDLHSKGSSLPLPASAVGNTNPPRAQSPPSDLQQGPPRTQALGQPRTTAALPKATQTTASQPVPKNPIQVVYKVPEGLGHLVKKDSGGPIKFSVHPVMDQNTGEKVMQQVVILPSNLLIHKAETKTTPESQQQSRGGQHTVSEVAGPLRMSTDVPGFSIPENRIPVQQVAPLRDARTVSSPPPSVLPCLQQGTTSTAGVKGPQVCSVPATKPQGFTSSPSPVTALSSALSTEPAKATDPKQELKTVCIRDSQSILVTTRGGNTGIVKVQASSDQSGFGSFPSSPVITISPQFRAFLVSKTSQTLSPSAPSQPPPSGIPPVTSVSVTHSHKQPASVLKHPSTVTVPIRTAVTGNIPITGPGSHSAGCTVAVNQGSLTSAGPTVGTKIAQQAQTTTASSQSRTPVLKNTAVPSLSRSNVPQLLTPEFVSKTGLKRASTDEGSQVPKFILVTPSSSSNSSIALPKGTPSSTKSVPTSRVMIIGQPTAASTSTTFMGSVPKQSVVTAQSGQAVAALPSAALKMGFSAGPPPGSVGSETLSQARNITPPSGFQIQLSGKTTTIGQSIGALSCSPSKCKPASVSNCPTATTNGPIPVTSLNPYPNSLTTSSQLRGIPSLSAVSQASCSTPMSAVPSPPAGNAAHKDLSMLAGVLSLSAPAQVTTTAESNPAQTSTAVPDSQHSFTQSGKGGEILSASASSQLACNKIPAPLSSAPASCTPFSTSSTGTVQQRIVINTSAPLAAGTQILLNNACFVVPPQGLGPGSHVLIISSPAPQQVPTASATSSGAAVPYQGAGNPTVASLAPVLPQCPAGLPAVPAVTPPTVAPSLHSSAPYVTPVKPTGTPGFSSTLLPGNTNVVPALPRSPAVQTGNSTSPAVDNHALGSPLPKLSSLPGLVSPVVSCAAAFSSALAAVRLPAPAQAACPSTVSLTVASTFPHLPGPLSSVPVLPSPSAVSLSVPALLCSAAAAVVADPPALHCSVPAQQMVTVTSLGPGILSQQEAAGVAAPSTGQPQALVHAGLGNSPIRRQAAVMQPMLSGTRTQVLPTVAVPPIVSAVSRIQTLPIATVPPIGSTVNSVETPPVGTAPSSNTAVAITPAQPITSLKTNNAIKSPVILSSRGSGKLSAQTSLLGVHANTASKLLISPDGAVLSTVQSRVGSAELAARPKPLDALEISTNRSAGALQTHDSSLQPI